VRPVAKREAVAHLQTRMGFSERRACWIIVADVEMHIVSVIWTIATYVGADNADLVHFTVHARFDALIE